MTKLGQFYKKYLEKIVPAYAVLSLIACFGLNSIIYFGAQVLMADARHYDLSIPIDSMIPFQSGWIYIYFLCYIEWTIGYIVITRQGREHWFRFALADMMSRIVCGIFFVFLPTTIARPDIIGNSLSDNAVRMLYNIDASSNLFPSIHCLVSWFCFIGVRNRKNVSIWYKSVMFVYAVLVFVSVVTLKQHVFVDIIAGVVLAEVCYCITKKTKGYRKLEKIFETVNNKVFGNGYYE